MSTTAAATIYDEFTESAIVRDIPLSRLDPSPTNPRKHFNEEQLQDLASDIRAHGILSPLRVRPTDDHFEIVFGERRYRAAQIACLEMVPCTISELSDLEVLELQIAENLQRADMTPLEEAEAFHRLQEGHPKYAEVKVLAAQVGKSVKTVRERLRLLALVPGVREALEADEITIGHALLIAQLEAKAQPEALKECFYPLYGQEKGARQLKALKDFENWFNSQVVLDPEAEVVPDLFPELAGEVAKVQAAGGAIVRITRSWQAPKARKGEPPILPSEQYREAKPKDACGVTGVVVLGRDRGTVERICVDQSCVKHWPKPARPATTPSASSGRKQTAEEKDAAAKARKREEAAREKKKAAEARRDRVQVAALTAVADKVTTAEPRLLRTLLTSECEDRDFSTGGPVEAFLTARFGLRWVSGYAVDKKAIAAIPDASLPSALAVMLVANRAYSPERLAIELKPYGIDVKKLDAQIAAEEKVAAKQASTPAAKTKPAAKASAKAKGAKKR